MIRMRGSRGRRGVLISRVESSTRARCGRTRPMGTRGGRRHAATNGRATRTDETRSQVGRGAHGVSRAGVSYSTTFSTSFARDRSRSALATIFLYVDTGR